MSSLSERLKIAIQNAGVSKSDDENGNLEYELVPLNPDYPKLNSKRDRLSIVGVVVEHRRKLKRR